MLTKSLNKSVTNLCQCHQHSLYFYVYMHHGPVWIHEITWIYLGMMFIICSSTRMCEIKYIGSFKYKSHHNQVYHWAPDLVTCYQEHKQKCWLYVINSITDSSCFPVWFGLTPLSTIFQLYRGGSCTPNIGKSLGAIYQYYRFRGKPWNLMHFRKY